MLTIQLFFALTAVSIIYLVLLYYTKFFSFPPYLARVSLNLHFYFTIVYIICFLLSSVLIAIDWSTSAIAEIILYTSPYSPYTSTSPADIPHIIVDQNGKFLGKIKGDEDPFVFLKNNENSFKNLNVNQHFSENASVKEDPSSNTNVTAHSPKETTPTSTKWYQFRTKVQHQIQHFVSGKLEGNLRDPSVTEGHPEMLKATLEGISTGKQSPLYDGPYTPEQVGITDLNDDSTLVPLFKKTVINPETGVCETYECTNFKKTIDIYNEKFEHVNETSRFNATQNYLIEKTLKTAGWEKTLCVKVNPNTAILENIEASSFSPKNPNLWDPSN